MKKKGFLILLVVAALSAVLVEANRFPAPLPENARADFVKVEKGKRKLSVYSNGLLLRTYSIALGRSPVGAKVREGDNKTPEGKYCIDWKKPMSGYHKSMHISYPSQDDVAKAKGGGYEPGGNIMLHGLRNGFGWMGKLHRILDWTHGCIALSNSEIDELSRIIPPKTPIVIQP